MSYTKTEISNLALSHARETLISGNVDTTTESIAETVLLHWDHCHRQLLRRVKPVFAQTRAALTETTAPAFEYDNAFLLPVDFVDIVQFNGATIQRTSNMFEIEAGKLLTDQAAANIVYIKNESDTAKYTPEYIEALSYLLGSKVANTRRGNQGLAGDLLTNALRAASEARAKDMQGRRTWNSRQMVDQDSGWTGYIRRSSTNDHISSENT